jgi:hypothetical protein
MMTRILTRIPLRCISFNFFKKKPISAQHQEIQTGFNNYKTNEGDSRVKIKSPSINIKISNEIIKELRQYTMVSSFIPKERSARANALLKKIIMARGFKTLIAADSEAQLLLEKLTRSLWEDIESFDDAQTIVNLFWLCVDSDFFLPSLGFIDYIQFFNVNSNRLSVQEIITVLNTILIRYRRINKKEKNPDEIQDVEDLNQKLDLSFKELSYEEKETIEDLANTSLRNLQQGTEDFFSLTEICTLLRSLKYPNQDFFSSAEQLMKDSLLPFNAQRTMAYLIYVSSKVSDSEDFTQKIEIFRQTAEFLPEQLKFCSFNDMYRFVLVYTKEVNLSTITPAKTLIENILNAILTAEELTLETIKLLDILELTKGKISIKYLRQCIRKTETHIMKEMNEVTPGQLSQFLFICYEVGYSFVYKEEFEKKMLKFVHNFSLDELLKATWANNDIFKNDEFNSKTISIVLDKLTLICSKNEHYVVPNKIMPFVWIFSVKLGQDGMSKFEVYLQKYMEKFDFRDLGVIFWSVVQKARLTNKTVLLLLTRYHDLLLELYTNEFDQSSPNKSKLYFKNIGTWETMKILWGFDNFQFPPDSKNMYNILQMSIPLLENLLDEFSKEEFTSIVRIYLKTHPRFDQFYQENQDFYKKIYYRTSEFFDDFTLEESITISKLLTGNPAILDSEKALAVKFVEHVYKLKADNIISTITAEDTNQSEKVLDARFKEHF